MKLRALLLLLPLLAAHPLTAHEDKKATKEHAHSHEPLLPAPTSTLESVQQVDALVAAMKAAVTEKRLGEIHDQTEAFSIALSALQRLGSEGLPEAKAKRLDGLAENLRKAADTLHHQADEPNQQGSEEALAKLEKLHPLVAAQLPEVAKEAADKPLEAEFKGKVKATE
jgi:hypothetical protein